MSLTQQWELAQQTKQETKQDIKTSAERNALEAQRPKPGLDNKLNPPGMNPDPNKGPREARIAEINAALQKANDEFKKDFEHSR